MGGLDEKKFQSWSIREAKAKLSEVIEQVQGGVPQLITSHGTPQALLLKVGSIEEIEEIIAVRKHIRRRLLTANLTDLRKAAAVEGVGQLVYQREDGREIAFDKETK